MAAHANGPHRQSKHFSESLRKGTRRPNLKFTIPYLDGCIIFSRTIEEHLERLREVFQRFKDAILKINPTECEFFRQKVPFLGHIVSREGIQADPAKISTVDRYPVPKNATEVKSFSASVHSMEDMCKTSRK